MSDRGPSLIGSIVKMKCPNCRKGELFLQKGLLPFKNWLAMPERCTICGQKYELEVGFWYGTGYVSYALSIALMVFNLLWYILIFGFSWQDNSIFRYLIISIIVIVILQP